MSQHERSTVRRKAAASMVLLAAVMSSFAPCGWADEAAVRRENQLKAAYLFNFVKFVDWPAARVGDVLTICVRGADGVHAALAESVDSKSAGAYRLTVRKLGANDALSDCHVLYLESAASMATHGSLAERHAVLTVSSAPNFARNGGMIELFTDSNRLRFIINVSETEQAGLRVSSNLLKLAVVVGRDAAR